MEMNRFDPDWSFAENHGKSTLPGKPTHELQDEMEHHLLCECCLNSVEKEPIPLCENSK